MHKKASTRICKGLNTFPIFHIMHDAGCLPVDSAWQTKSADCDHRNGALPVAPPLRGIHHASFF
ncbi:hypothetical protein DFZ86_22245 [Escherichia coli]|nr:hypothetical protein [Escherichia coli]EFD9215282.1 hypothetical protein [Escherichia coli]QEG90326.1 hypothetical protein FS611_01695 [Escherichia coli]QHG40148.1 hypothetical protein FOV95_13865 [Escherichia coli]HAH2867566.1 hypothetical protein [Escherichia coli]